MEIQIHFTNLAIRMAANTLISIDYLYVLSFAQSQAQS